MTEDARECYRWGQFRFEIEGTEQTLQAYKAAPDEARLWIPFRDATAGDETYGAGRYLDLEADEHRTPDGEWVIDFNPAYNPLLCVLGPVRVPAHPDEELARRVDSSGRADPRATSRRDVTRALGLEGLTDWRAMFRVQVPR